MIRAVMIAAVVLILSAGPAAAGYLTGNKLLAKCHVYERLVAAGRTTNDINVAAATSYCQGHVWGLADGFARAGASICFPNRITYDQILAVTLKHLKENPAQLHRPSGALVETALQKAWPCN